MTFTTIAAPTTATKSINFQMASSILDRLGYELEEIDIHGEGNGSGITHHLFYRSISSSCNILGYVNCENGIYYVNPANNHRTAECAALELLDREVVEYCRVLIELERAASPDYD